MSDHLEQVLLSGMESMGLSTDAKTLGCLLQFHKLLEKWNRTYNLSSIRDPLKMIRLHLLDSLAVAPYLSGLRIADVGTGAGLPGIPLALLDTDKSFFLIDSDSKKTRFIQQAVIELRLENVSIIHGPSETIQLQEKVDVVVTRAFSSLVDIIKKTKHLLSEKGIILALKGRFPVEELSAVADVTYSVIPLSVPGVDAERHLISLKPGLL